MAKLKKQNNSLDFKNFQLLQKQFNILNSEIIYNSGTAGDETTLTNLFDDLHFIISLHSGEDQNKIDAIFENFKTLLESAETRILLESKKFLNKKIVRL